MFSNRFIIAVAIFGSAFLLSSITFAVSDDPDLKKEKQLHQTYKTFNTAPTKEESWASAVGGKTQTYSIQQGDTLWDLSNALFGDSQFWPKVWSINADKIENPHEIFPGMTVHFTPGTTGEAPNLSMKATQEEVHEIESDVAKPAPLAPAEANFQKENLERVQIPPEVPAVNATKLPDSLPYWTFGRAKSELIFQLKPVDRKFKSPEQPLSYYISDQPIQGIGTLTEAEMNQTRASEFQYVYVKLNEGVSAKDITAVKDAGELKDPYSDTSARLIQVQGELEILEKVNTEENIYRAIVKKAINPIEIGSQVVAGGMPRYNANETGASAGSAYIVGGQHSTNRRMFDPQSIVFLNGQGLVEGQTYPIFKKQSLRNEKTKSVENPRQIGRVKVVKTSSSFATGVIVQSNEEVQVGDVTSPQMTK